MFLKENNNKKTSAGFDLRTFTLVKICYQLNLLRHREIGYKRTLLNKKYRPYHLSKMFSFTFYDTNIINEGVSS